MKIANTCKDEYKAHDNQERGRNWSKRETTMFAQSDHKDTERLAGVKENGRMSKFISWNMGCKFIVQY